MTNPAAVATPCALETSSPRTLTLRGAVLGYALVLIAFLGTASQALAATAGAANTGTLLSPQAHRAAYADAKKTLLKLPLRFESTADGEAMAVHLGDRQLRLGKAGAVESRGATGDVLSITLEGANEEASPVGQAKLPGRSNYFIGRDASKWRKGVEQFSQARVKNVYDGIDLLYYGNGNELEHDYVLTPGSDPSRIRMRISGGTSRIDEGTGDLIVSHADVKQELVRLARPVAYQSQADGARTRVEVGYAQNANGSFGFSLGEYDHALPLTIDPVVTYSTYFGGSNNDEVNDIKTDAAGNLVLLLATSSTDLPMASQIPNACNGTCGPTNPSPQGGPPRTYDFYLAKLDPTGQTLLYSTYIGGSADDSPGALVIAPDGSLYISGQTRSADFPVVNGYPSALPDYFHYYSSTLTKLSADGSTILYSSLIGAGLVNSFENSGYSSSPGSLAVAPNGIAYLVGYACCGRGSFLDAKNTSFTEGGGSFIAKFDTTKSGNDSLLYATTFGKQGDIGGEALQSIALDSKQNLWVFASSISSASNPIPTPDAVQPVCDGGGQCDNAILHGLTPAGAIFYTTFLGGTKNSGGGPGIEIPIDIVIDSSDNIYLSGSTESVDFPLKNAAFTALDPETTSNFLTKLSPGAKSILYSTYTAFLPLLATLPDGGIAAVGNGIVPQVNAIPPNVLTGEYYSDIAFEVFDTTKSGMDSLLISSYLGSLATPIPEAVSVDAQGNLLIAGVLGTTNLLLVNPYQSTCATCGYPDFAADGFVTRVQLASGSLTLTPAAHNFVDTTVGASSAAQTSTLTNTTATAITLSAGTLSDTSDFSVSDDCGGTVASGGSCTVTFTFKPQSAGALSATYSIYDVNNSSVPLNVSLSGTGVAAPNPAATVTPTSYDFSKVTTGTTSAPATFQVANTGNVVLRVTGATITGNGFAVTGGAVSITGTLPVGGSSSFTVTFSPTEVGAANGTIQIITDAGTKVVTLTGTGVPPATPQAVLSPTTADFSSVNVGSTSPAQMFTLTNAGNAALAVTSVAPTGTNANSFAVGANSCGTSLAAGGSCTIAVSFSPLSVGSLTAALSVVDSVGTQSVALSGTGVGAPRLVLTPTTFSFGAVPAGSAPTETVTLTNAGMEEANFVYGSSAVSNGLQIAATGNTCQTTLAPGASCTIPVQLTGADTGSAQFTIDIAGNSGTNSVAASLIGFGAAGGPPPTFIDLGNGFITGALTFNGSAIASNGVLQLTANQPGEASSAFYTTPVSTTTFSTDFAFKLLDPLAEGLTFTIQANNPNAIGTGGGGLGYQGIGKSIALKLDLRDTAGEGDNSTGIYINGAAPTVPATTLAGTGIDLHSGHVFTLHIDYDGTTESIILTDTATQAVWKTQAAEDIPTLLGSDTAYFGFTASTEAATTNADTTKPSAHPLAATSPTTTTTSILDWTYTTAPTPATLTPTSLDFGSVAVGSASGVQTAKLTNTGTAPFTIASVTASDPVASGGKPGQGGTNDPGILVQTSSCSEAVTPGNFCKLEVSLTAGAVGAYTGTVVIKYYLGDGSLPSENLTATLKIIGNGVAPNVSLIPTSADFGSISTGHTSSPKIFTFTNSTGGPLTVSYAQIGYGGPGFNFGTGLTCSPQSILPAGQSCTIPVVFAPTTVGSVSNTLALPYVDGGGYNGTVSATLTGTGQDVSPNPPDFTVTAIDSALTVIRGSSAKLVIDVGPSNANPFTAPVTFTASGLPNGATATFAPSTLVPGSGTSTIMTVSVPALGARNQPLSPFSPGGRNAAFGISAAALIAGLFGFRRRLNPRLLLCLCALSLIGAITGCGSGAGFTIPTETSTITVTATSGSITHTISVTLTVQ